MDTIQIIILAIVQGLTEFLPISSSAHLILIPPLVGWPDQGLEFDVAVHLGTLIAVMVYFRQQISTMLVAWFYSLLGRGVDAEAKLAWGIALATVPVCLAGLLLKGYIESDLRSPLVIAWATILFGLLLWAADAFARRRYSEAQMSWRHYLLIGVAQVLALIPGTSRSGITMTAALMLGFEREVAARFSFLLSIPVILLSAGLVSKDLLITTQTVDWVSLGLGTLVSGACAFICIHFFLKWIQQIGMLPFVVYRIALGGVLLLVFGL